MSKKNKIVVQFDEAEIVERSKPIPLLKEEIPPKAYPVKALGKILAGAVNAIVDQVQCPETIAAQSVLAAAALAVQPHADVAHPANGSRVPISLFVVTVAASGDRKSAADRIALDPVRLREAELIDQCQRDHRDFVNHRDAYQRARDMIIKTFKGDREELGRKIATLGPVPQSPLRPMLIAQDPTLEGLQKQFAVGQPSMGLFSDEGGLFIGGHGMTDDTRLKTSAGLSGFWDGTPVSRLRVGDGATSIKGRRLTVHLMVQPGIADGLLENPVLKRQGLLSRILVAAPASIAGTRMQKPLKATTEPALKKYQVLMLKLLRKEQKRAAPSDPSLVPPQLTLSDQAKKKWIAFADEIELELGSDGHFEPIKAFANKSAEHALRIAAVLQMVEKLDATEISAEVFDRAVVLTRFYLDEALRLYEQGQNSEALVQADKMLKWLHASGKTQVGMGQICQYGPNSFREVATARRIMQTLADYGWVMPLPIGTKIDAHRYKEAWEVVRD